MVIDEYVEIAKAFFDGPKPGSSTPPSTACPRRAQADRHGRSVDAAGEFELIERLLRPLAHAARGRSGLLDDAAVLPARPGFDLVVTKDAIVEGVHFLPDDPLDRSPASCCG